MTFDADKTVRYWLESAAYDLETGRILLESKRFPLRKKIFIENVQKNLRVRNSMI